MGIQHMTIYCDNLPELFIFCKRDLGVQCLDYFILYMYMHPSHYILSTWCAFVPFEIEIYGF